MASKDFLDLISKFFHKQRFYKFSFLLDSPCWLDVEWTWVSKKSYFSFFYLIFSPSIPLWKIVLCKWFCSASWKCRGYGSNGSHSIWWCQGVHELDEKHFVKILDPDLLLLVSFGGFTKWRFIIPDFLHGHISFWIYYLSGMKRDFRSYYVFMLFCSRLAFCFFLHHRLLQLLL